MGGKGASAHSESEEREPVFEDVNLTDKYEVTSAANKLVNQQRCKTDAGRAIDLPVWGETVGLQRNGLDSSPGQWAP